MRMGGGNVYVAQNNPFYISLSCCLLMTSCFGMLPAEERRRYEEELKLYGLSDSNEDTLYQD